jgi:hypothetical protein
VTLDIARCCALSCLVGSSELSSKCSSTLSVFGSTLLCVVGGSAIVAKDAQLRANHVDVSCRQQKTHGSRNPQQRSERVTDIPGLRKPSSVLYKDCTADQS